MLTIPVYDFLLLPGVTFYFRKDTFPSSPLSEEKVGEEVLFLMAKNEQAMSQTDVDGFYPIAVRGKIENFDNQEDAVRVRIDDRVTVSNLRVEEGEILADLTVNPLIEDEDQESREEQFQKVKKDMMEFSKGYQWGIWARNMIYHWKSIEEAICAVSGYLNLTAEAKYEILAMDSRKERSARIQELIFELLEVFKVGEEAASAQKDSTEKLYREGALKKQIEILQRELDAMHPENISDVRRFEKKIQEAGMNPEAEREALKVLNRMKQEGKDSHEYGLLYDYLDFVTSLSWKKEPVGKIDLAKAEKILDEDHYGLKKVKERIIEQLAVMALTKENGGSILLFVGAPGTGKTSIGQSIAKALGRKYVRISLGGIRDEAEIRGHRRTYVGAMPGRIMEGIKRSGASNPVVVLDEVDKLVRDYGGDPSSALLEVLDPEQNFSFTDHYMNVPYDLSRVFFVCTANSEDTIPEPLRNRMEAIHFPGYTPVEKFHIGKEHLLPRAMKSMGIKRENLRLSDDALRRIIEEYTAESGVRGLKKQIDVLCRHAAVTLVKGEKKSLTVGEKRVPEFLGTNHARHEKILEEPLPGVATGLAWTAAGGEVLFIETRLTSGKGEVSFTGQLGDVMKESAQIAVSLSRSLYPVESEVLKDHNLHIHVPSGAVPKDGPSAGVTLVTALVSLFTGLPTDTELAMTGEVSLRGKVMPIGGLPEKLMAAQRAGIKKVLIPEENVEDLKDVPEEVRNGLTIQSVSRIEEVLSQAIVGLKG